jgi:hypothetical protein
MAEKEDTDWGEWSREAVRVMQERNEQWSEAYGLASARYYWDIVAAQIVFERPADVVVADICIVGSVSESEGTFLWSWANEAIPDKSRAGIAAVRAFGAENDLRLLIDPEWPANRAEGLEMLAIAGRILNAEGAWVDAGDNVTLFFTLHNFRTSPK